MVGGEGEVVVETEAVGGVGGVMVVAVAGVEEEQSHRNPASPSLILTRM
jgi:hypothetical protein